MSNSNAYYCCDLKCFPAPNDQVDGEACSKCRFFCYCHCNCLTYKRRAHYCCDSKCFKAPCDQVDGEACSKCESYGYCICKCATYKRRNNIQDQPLIDLTKDDDFLLIDLTEENKENEDNSTIDLTLDDSPLLDITNRQLQHTHVRRGRKRRISLQGSL